MTDRPTPKSARPMRPEPPRPMNDDAILIWADRLGIGDAALVAIQNVRTSNPERRVRSTVKSVSGRYPSRKMGCIIQYESRHVEAAAVVLMEYDSDTLEFYDQPPRINFDYAGVNGRRKAFGTTADFFVIDADGAGWDEWKREKHLTALAEEDPRRWVCDGGHWRCPPGEDYAAQFGLRYRLRSSAEINGDLVTNCRFLERYFRRPIVVDMRGRKAVVDYVFSNPGVSARELVAAVSAVTVDDVNQMIADDTVYVDLETRKLADPDHTYVFADQAASDELKGLVESLAHEPLLPPVALISTEPGSRLLWDGVVYEVVNAGETSLWLRREDGSMAPPLSSADFEGLLKRGQLSAVEPKDPQAHRVRAVLVHHKASRVADGVVRSKAVRASLAGEAPGVPGRSVRRWKALDDKGGFEALISKNRPGNTTPRFEPRVLAIVEEAIGGKTAPSGDQATTYASFTAPSVPFMHGLVVNRCRDEHLPWPSLKTFRKMIRQPGSYAIASSRLGRRGAYAIEPWSEYDPVSPVNGDRPWEIAHLDHTELDIQLVDSRDSSIRLGRPWATFLIDAYSRRMLSVWLSFDPPSYRAAMMAIRLCGQRWSRLPEKIGVDGGKEFASTYFETLLARWEVAKEQRPAAKPRYGSVLERLIGTLNVELIHNLQGNTKLSRNVRQMTKETDPATNAVWTLGRLYRTLSTWSFDTYDRAPHTGLEGSSPRDAYALRLALVGAHSAQFITDIEAFVFDSLPSTRTGSALVNVVAGVKINGIWYWHPLMSHPSVEGREVDVKYDPLDIRHAWAFLDKQWRECRAKAYRHLPARSEREFAILSTEIHRRLTIAGAAGVERSAAVARQVSAEPGEWAAQRRRDEESERALAMVTFEIDNRELTESDEEAGEEIEAGRPAEAAQPEVRTRRKLEKFL
jgi:putative transposase